MRTHISDESSVQLGGKVRPVGNFGRRELAPEEVIRIVKERFRICNYLALAQSFWVLGAAVVATGLKFSESESRMYDVPTVIFLMILIASATSVFTLAVNFAVMRCPVCDKYLSRFREDKFHCPRCSAQVKEPA